jgi:dihydrodipicolinate synthase/N-acetylneuraminate lyase
MNQAPIGVMGVLQTPFLESREIDWTSYEGLIGDALSAGIDGFLVPAIASENAWLSLDEKLLLARKVQETVLTSVPVFWAAGSTDPSICRRVIEEAELHGATGCVVAVPPPLYAQPELILEFFTAITQGMRICLMVQDWEPGGTGLTLETIRNLFVKIPQCRAIKVETLPAGPKYTGILKEFGGDLHVSGGWAVQQYIEGLDRGVHAMIPECSMIRIYKRIDSLHRAGQREAARSLFWRLLPVLAFTNQELDTSIRFFKRLLVRKGIFQTPVVRLQSPGFDAHSERIAEELIELVLEIENSLG